MSYLVKKPRWLRKFYGKCTWQAATTEPLVFLTFDDGPHPGLTPFVLEELKKHDAKATFFCLGTHVEQYPDLYRRILEEGHATGNHTHTHPDGWKTPNKQYYADILRAKQSIGSSLFRPPHGHITPLQVRRLRDSPFDLNVVMWNILSGDFDPDTSPEQCYENAAKHIAPGAIVVFHDNEAAAPNLKYTLPRILDRFSEEGYRFAALSEQYLFY